VANAVKLGVGVVVIGFHEGGQYDTLAPMSKRALNFNPGPAALPVAALERARAELLDFGGSGMSIMEHSHRGPEYEAVHDEAIALLRSLLGIGDSHHVLFLQGGARMQFAMIPMNLLPEGRSADYIVTGEWAQQAYLEAKMVGEARMAANTEHAGTFRRVPKQEELALDREAAYVHITSNNTLFGVQWHAYPDTAKVPLIADMTSDIGSRRFDPSRFALFYAGAQKNLGPAGVTIVVVKKELLASARQDRPAALRYASYADTNSLWNTPPTFAIYMLRNTLAVLAENGGVEAAEKEARAKSELVYGAIDAHPDFYRCPVEVGSRSVMNAVFRLPSEALEKKFLAEASALSMVGLKGHRKVGGIRASLYNFVERAWVERLAQVMDEFARKNR
jgi:phosphoserine aminotransferase